MEIRDISMQEFVAFSSNCPYTTIYQSPNFARIKEKEGMEVLILGGFEDNVLRGATILLCERMFLHRKFCIAVKGFLLDYQDFSLVTDFVNAIKKETARRNCLLLRINPAFLLQERDENGEIVEGGFDHHSWVEHLISCGFTHEGFTTGLPMDRHVRWTFVISIAGMDENTLFANMNKQTQRNLHTAEKSHIRVHEITRKEDLAIFISLMESTSKRRHFEIFDQKYYEEQFDYYGPDQQVKFLYAQFYVLEYIEDLQQQIHQVMEKIKSAKQRSMQGELNEKAKRKWKQNEDELEKLQRKLDEANRIHRKHGDSFPIATGNFFLYQKEITYFHGGSDADYMQFCAQYAIQWYMMKYGIAHNYERFNMNGISGIFHDSAPDFGVYRFKKGFGGHVEEYPGYFNMVINKPLYQVMRVAGRIKRMLRKGE